MLIGIVLPRAAGEIVTEGIFRFRFRCMTCRTREGFFTRHRAGGLCRHFSVVPHVIGSRVGGIATGTLLPVLIGIALPRAAGEVVTEGIFRFRFGFIAGGTGKGSHARLCASGLCRHFPVIPGVIVQFHYVAVECGFAFPGDGANIFAAFQRCGVKRVAGLAAQCIADHVTRHGGGKGKIRIIRVTAGAISGYLHCILAVLRSGEGIIIVVPLRGCDRATARTGKIDAGDIEIAGAD